MAFTPVFKTIPKDVVEWARFFTAIRNANGTVDDTQLRDSAALSIIGRASNSTGAPSDIASSTNDTFLVRRSNALGWGALAVGDITADMVTQHIVAIRTFLPKPEPQRSIDDAGALLAARVFRQR